MLFLQLSGSGFVLFVDRRSRVIASWIALKRWQDRFDRLWTREISCGLKLAVLLSRRIVTSFCSTQVACKERQSLSSPVDVVDEDRDASCSFARIAAMICADYLRWTR